MVSNAYVRAPAPPTDAAAAYFTVSNTTGTTGPAGGGGQRRGGDDGAAHAGMTADADGAVIPAHGKLVLSTGKGHVMIEQLFGTLQAPARTSTWR